MCAKRGKIILKLSNMDRIYSTCKYHTHVVHRQKKMQFHQQNRKCLVCVLGLKYISMPHHVYSCS